MAKITETQWFGACLMMIAKHRYVYAALLSCFLAATSAACTYAQKTSGFEGLWGSYQPEVRTSVDTFLSISKLDAEKYLVLWVNTSTSHPASSVTIGVVGAGDRLTFVRGQTTMILTYLSDKRGDYLAMKDSGNRIFDEYFRVSKIPIELIWLSSRQK
jgi:S-formylglutathione hydrolase FrmB